MMKPEIIEDYIEKVYGYAVNRTYTRDEADELSQEILLTVIRELPKLRDDSKFEPWLWGIANNVAKSFRRFKGKNRATYSYDVLENIPYEESDEGETEEIYDFLRTKIAMLSEICRNIIILYYYDGLSTKEIADKLNIPEGTVTWRLSAGRKKLKKEFDDMNETALRPVRMNIGIYGNGDYDGKRKPFPSVYIDDALSQNILYYSYEKPCAIEELAKLCGVPAYYIEDRIRHLLKYEAMVEATKGKYQTDFIIWSDKYGIYCEENAEKTLMPIMDDLLSALKEISMQAMKLDFHKAEKSESDLFYLFGVLAFSYASTKYCSLPFPWFKKRFDGNEWSYIGNIETGKHKRIGIGVQYSANLGSRGGCSYKAFNSISGIVFRPVMYDNYINVCQDIIFDGKTDDIDSLANAIKDGYIIKRDDGSLFVTSPVFTIDQTESFNRIVETYLFPHIDKYTALVYKFVEGYKNLFPKHLHDDADRMCQNMFLGMYSVIVEYAQRTGQIKMPSKNCYCDVIQQFK